MTKQVNKKVWTLYPWTTGQEGSAPQAVAATPTFSPAAGSYAAAQSVAITSSPGTTILYTTDGSTPFPGSPPYTGPITVNVSETLKAIAYGGAYAQSAVGSAAYTIGSNTGYLAAGHYISAAAAGLPSPTAVYPQPDASTNTWARHRWFYYDPTNGPAGGTFPQTIPMGVRGGSYPYVWEIIALPANCTATIGVAGNAAGVAAGNANGYGDLVVTPTGTFTGGTFQIRCWDQDKNYIDLIWTASTSASQFVFINADTGNDSTGTGTYAAPYKTLLKVYGATNTTTTVPGSIVVMIGNTTAEYQAYDMSSGYGIMYSAQYGPMSLIGYPGTLPVISIANGGHYNCFNAGGNGTNTSDVFFQNFQFDSSVIPPGSTTYRYFESDKVSHRFTAHDVLVPNCYSGTTTTGISNLTTFYWDAPGAMREEIFLKGCTESGRTNVGGQGYGLINIFYTDNILVEFCQVTNCTAGEMVYPKQTTTNTERRMNIIEGTGHFATGDTIPVPNGPNSVNYNVVVYTGTSTGNQVFGTRWNENANSQTLGYQIFRNTFVGASNSLWASTGTVFNYLNNVFQYQQGPNATNTNTGPIYWNSSGAWISTSLPANITGDTATNPCIAKTGVVDSSYNLTGSYTTYLGEYGAQIA